MKTNKNYYWIIGLCLIIQFFIFSIQDRADWVEFYYSRRAYPIIAYINKFLFSWIPFSFGDLFYVLLIGFIVYTIVQLTKNILQRNGRSINRVLLRFITVILCLYTVFYVNWGLNYYRNPIYVSTGLNVEAINKADYLSVLDTYIQKANAIRAELDLETYSKDGVNKDIENLMLRDTLFDGILAKSQVKIKQPISSTLVSYFTVSGYFNPFTSEVQVNQLIPKASYPFVNVHELAHQMGIGFEDDCNYIAFRKLMEHDNLWYRYSAYYSAIQSLLQPIYGDKVLFEKYKSMLSDDIKKDLNEERLFWRSYSGFIDEISAVFYNGYLKHNNQPEGLERYNMMARLIVAWEMQR